MSGWAAVTVVAMMLSQYRGRDFLLVSALIQMSTDAVVRGTEA